MSILVLYDTPSNRFQSVFKTLFLGLDISYVLLRNRYGERGDVSIGNHMLSWNLTRKLCEISRPSQPHGSTGAIERTTEIFCRVKVPQRSDIEITILTLI